MLEACTGSTIPKKEEGLGYEAVVDMPVGGGVGGPVLPVLGGHASQLQGGAVYPVSGLNS